MASEVRGEALDQNKDHPYPGTGHSGEVPPVPLLPPVTGPDSVGSTVFCPLTVLLRVSPSFFLTCPTNDNHSSGHESFYDGYSRRPYDSSVSLQTVVVTFSVDHEKSIRNFLTKSPTKAYGFRSLVNVFRDEGFDHLQIKGLDGRLRDRGKDTGVFFCTYLVNIGLSYFY